MNNLKTELDYDWQNSIKNFMYRRPILCTLHGAVDFLKFLNIAVVGGGGEGATGI
jgi:hypothetical protein